MLDVIEAVLAIGDLLTFWRIYIVAAVTIGLIWLVFCYIPSETMRWIIIAIFLVIGICAAFFWQILSSKIKNCNTSQCLED